MSHNRSVGDNRYNRKENVEEEPKKDNRSGIAPYVIGGLFGVAVGLVGSYLLDKVTEQEQPLPPHRESACVTGVGEKCCICLDEVGRFLTPCCNKYLHEECYRKYKYNSSRCPLCRKSWK